MSSHGKPREKSKAWVVQCWFTDAPSPRRNGYGPPLRPVPEGGGGRIPKGPEALMGMKAHWNASKRAAQTLQFARRQGRQTAHLRTPTGYRYFLSLSPASQLLATGGAGRGRVCDSRAPDLQLCPLWDGLPGPERTKKRGSLPGPGVGSARNWPLLGRSLVDCGYTGGSRHL